LDGFRITNGKDVLGGGVYCDGASPILINNSIEWNMGTNFGGGVYLKDSSAILLNNWIVNNDGVAAGGGVYLANSNAILTHCTLSLNVGVIGDGVYGDANSSATITNCILWDNGSIELGGPCSYDVAHSDIKGGFPGLNNINQDPLFIEPGFGDFHIQYGSPCIGVGDVSAPWITPHDMDINPRFEDSFVDLGADEFYRHFYMIGDFSPNGNIRVRTVGEPNSQSGSFFSLSLLKTPMPIAYGYWYLNFPIYPVPSAPTGTNGFFTMLGKIPSTPPKFKLPTQSMIGTSSSNAKTSNAFVLYVD